MDCTLNIDRALKKKHKEIERYSINILEEESSKQLMQQGLNYLKWRQSHIMRSPAQMERPPIYKLM
jgi:hypothetical protein